MGQSFVISCTECDYKKEWMLGIGKMYGPAHKDEPSIPGISCTPHASENDVSF